MITTKDIYDKTRNGLDILLHFFPQAAETVGCKNKAFKIRTSDDTPSAYIKEIKGIWRMTDFGDSDQSRTPIDVVMDEKGIPFNEAIIWCANEFSVDGAYLSREKNKAVFDRRPASEEEKEGSFSYVSKPFSAEELLVMGPKVKEDTISKLGWISIKSYSRTKLNKEGVLITTTVSSSDGYPIFMRECRHDKGSFFKIYQPLNPDKAYRFFYQGEKPANYINGLIELQEAYSAYNAEEEKIFRNSNPAEGAVYSEKKLPEAFICSGERDAACISSYGFSPIWFNSESYNLSDREYAHIMKFVDRLYNIPDIDATGLEKGKKLANRFLEVFTIWLPKKLRSYFDNRGKPRKDFRDYCEIWPTRQDLLNLMALAMPARFWEYKTQKGQQRLEINSAYAIHFLTVNGFATLPDKNSKSGKMFVHLNGNVVKEIEAKDIRSFFINTAKERFLNIDIRNLIYNSARLSADSLMALDELDLDFSNSTPNSQLFFFPNKTYEVFADSIVDHGKTSDKYVWDSDVIQHRASLMDKAFKINGSEDHRNIEVLNNESPFFRMLINTSRIHWRSELEEQFRDAMNSDEAIAYRKENHFNIAGPYLDDQQIKEQKDHLINKIFAIGYLLHRYKVNNRAWCIFAMDNRVSETEDSNGGSGKSATLKALRHFMNTVTLSGRNAKITDNSHIYENVSEWTDMILVDDADRYLPFGFFFDSVTGEINVNPKFARSYVIPFEQAAKFAITSNYTPDRGDDSTQRRLLYMVFSDYYHERTPNNDYLESRTIYDDFQKNLFAANYTEEEWNADINFMMQCCQFYLSTVQDGGKINPPMQNVMARSLRAIMTDEFYSWAEVFFSEGSENCDCLVNKKTAYDSFVIETGKRITAHRFRKSLNAYCKFAPHVLALNPPELCCADGRIIKKKSGVSTEYIYIQTKDVIDYAGFDFVS